MSNEKAFAILTEYNENVSGLRRKEIQAKFGYDLFNINYTQSSDL
jgi:hypothetical protein